jgi:hypothetical protein
MKAYWGAFVQSADPAVPGQAAWPQYGEAREVLSLQPGGHSALVADAALADEHQCAFWDALPTG